MMNRNLIQLTSVLTLGLLGCTAFWKGVSAAQKLPLSTNLVSLQANYQVHSISATRIVSNTLLIAELFPSAANTSADQFLDDRSTPVQLLKSYYNAINRKEYVRAYYYWGLKGNSASSQPLTYPQFEAGYANTKAAQLTTGKVISEGAAGSFYFRVPITLAALHADGSKHTYVGCYTIRQPNPKNFGAPPFIPMHIYSAKIREVSSNSNTAVLMNSSCQ